MIKKIRKTLSDKMDIKLFTKSKQGMILFFVLCLENILFCAPLKIPKLLHPPRIDGFIDNTEWAKAQKIEDFLQLRPRERGIPSERTELFIGYDSKNLYLAARCFDSEPANIRASVAQRDKPISDDWIEIIIDSFYEKRRAYFFSSNPLGIQMDGLQIFEGEEIKPDWGWDAIFSSSGRITKNGYEVELAIPFKSFRFPNKKVHTWGIIAVRNIPRKLEMVTFPVISKDIPNFLVQEAELVIEDDIERGKNIEIMPILASSKRSRENAGLEPGVNLKIGINSNMVLDATLNPDYSHIEADAPQIDVNQRYALYWAEKRPFFLEGNEIFKHPYIDLIYTRKIVNPQWGAKITGKSGRFTIGYIAAVDNSASEFLVDSSGEISSGKNRSLFNILRMKMDLRDESYVGFSFTDKGSNDSSNRVLGLDGQQAWNSHFYLGYQVIASKSEENGVAKKAVPAYYLSLSYISRHWTVIGNTNGIHPEFESHSGFIERTGYRHVRGSLIYSFYPEKKYLLRISPSLSICQFYDFKRLFPIERWFLFKLTFQIAADSEFWFALYNNMERYQDIDFKKYGGELNFRGNFIKWLEFEESLKIGDSIRYDPGNPYLGWNVSNSTWLNFKPSTRVRIGISYLRYTFWKERGGQLVINDNVFRQKVEYQFFPSLSARLVLDFNAYYKKIYGSFLLSYILKPGIVFFLGYDDLYTGIDGFYTRTSSSFFLKVSYWWRI